MATLQSHEKDSSLSVLVQVITDQEFYDDIMTFAPHMDLTLLVMPTRRLPLEQTVRRIALCVFPACAVEVPSEHWAWPCVHCCFWFILD